MSVIFDDNYRLSLLGNWLLGKHREDMQYFDDSLFTSCKHLYRGISEGKSQSQLMADNQLDNFTLTDLLSAGTAGKFDDYVLYDEALSAGLVAQRTLLVRQLNEPNKDEGLLMNKIKELSAVIAGEEYKPIATNYKEILFKELDEIAEEEIAQYGKGFEFLDRFTDGMHRGQLTVLGGRPRTGKSAMALQIAKNVAENGYKVLFLPLEMTVAENLRRVLLHSQIVEPEQLKANDFDKDTAGAYLDALEENLKFCESLNSVESIEKMIKSQQPYCVVIDQLSQLKIKGHHKDNRERYIAITRELKRIALEYKVAILLLSQLNRLSADKKPGLESLHESDSTGQDADNVFLLYTEKDAEETDSPERITYLKIAKQRNGVSGKEIPLMYRGERFTFSAVDTSTHTAFLESLQ